MPHVIVIAGPNGAGKSTIAPALLRDTLGVTEFVNADNIAAGLSPFAQEKAAIPAGRIMLQRIDELAETKVDFAFETTLASKSFYPKLKKMREDGYKFKLVFIWLGNYRLAQERVLERVRKGGHNIPKETIRRRYESGLKNFFNLYLPIADNWYFYDNTEIENLNLIASCDSLEITEVSNLPLWKLLRKTYEAKL